MKTKNNIYMVKYTDDEHRVHLAFVKEFSSVRFIMDRFDYVEFELTDSFYAIENYEESDFCI